MSLRDHRLDSFSLLKETALCDVCYVCNVMSCRLDRHTQRLSNWNIIASVWNTFSMAASCLLSNSEINK